MAIFRGTNGADELLGGSEDDQLFGLNGNDTLSGGDGDDTLFGNAGANVLTGGAGRDEFALQFQDATDRITDFTEDDVIVLFSGDASFAVQSDLAVSASGGRTTLSLDSDGNGSRESGVIVEGTFGADEFVVLPSLVFRTFPNTPDFDGYVTNGTRIYLTDASGSNRQGEGDRGVGEFRVGSNNADTVTLTTGTDDTLAGRGGNDDLRGGAGFDLIDGGDGNDTLRGDDGGDVMLGGGGADRLIGGAGNDSMLGGADDDFLEGQNGRDTLVGGTGDDTLDGFNNNDDLDGGDGNDELFGGGGGDVLRGGAGNDLLDLGNQNDSGFGGDGNDTIIGGNDADQINGGAGDDLIYGDDAPAASVRSVDKADGKPLADADIADTGVVDTSADAEVGTGALYIDIDGLG